MKDNYKKITVFISNPSDVERYKNIIKVIVEDINQKFDNEYLSYLKVEEYKVSVVPRVGPNAETHILDSIKDYDIYIGIFGKKFGSPTGNYNPLTNLEYESGTEEEFYDALKKYESTDLPISVFFKTKVGRIKTSDEAEQLVKLKRFREKLIKEHKFIVDFKDDVEFNKKVFDFLLDSLRTLSKNKNQRLIKVDQLNRITKIRYTSIDDYLPRTVISYNEAISPEYDYLRHLNSKNLIDVIKNVNRIALLADAGCGKSIELERIASLLSEEKYDYYPMLIKLNTYTNDKIENLLEQNWNVIPEQALLLLFDALDEVEGNHRITFIKELIRFSEEHSDCKIIISCRHNFYLGETKDNTGTLKGFTSYVLNPLDWDEIEKFLEKKLNKETNDFIAAVNNNKTIDLLDNPFYLRFLVDKYKLDKNLPKTRSEIFEQLIQSRLQLDEEHFKNSNDVDVIESRVFILQDLMKLALCMEILGRNHITAEEYIQIITEDKNRRLLEQKTLWRIRGDKWQFEHNIFQEYLTAKLLSSQSLTIIKKIITFSPGNNIIIPTWLNTLSFLLNLYPGDDLRKWILDIQPELTIKFEPDRINKSLRAKIFINIFDNYRVRKIWIDHEKFNIYELAKFGEVEESIKYLLTFLNISNYYTVVGNAILLLSRMKIPLDFKQKVLNSLLLISTKYSDTNIQSYAIIGLSQLKYLSKEIVDLLLNKLGKLTDDYIRYAMYAVIEENQLMNDYIEYFLDGIKYTGLDGRIGNESWHLENGIKKANNIDAIIKILHFLVEHPEVCHKIGFDRVIPQVMRNAASTFISSNDENIFNEITQLYIKLHQIYLHEEAKFCLEFYNITKTRSKAFRNIYALGNKNKTSDLFSWLAYLSDYECSEIILDEYRIHKINDNDIWVYQSFLDQNNEDLYHSFNKRINEISNNNFEFKPQRDFKKDRDIKFSKDLELLFDKNKLIKEIKSVFINEGKEFLESNTIRDIKYHRWLDKDQTTYSNISLEVLDEILEKSNKNYLQVSNVIRDMDWEYYSIKKIYNYIEYKNDFSPNAYLLRCLENWCLKQLKTINFNDVIIEEKGSITTNLNAIILWTFLRKFKFNFPKPVMLDLLSFDWHNIGIDYLEEFISLDEIQVRIFQNFKNKKNKNTELKNYFRFCLKHKLKASKKYAEIEILNSNREISIRELGLELLVALGTNNQKLYNLLIKIDDAFKWKIIEILVKNRSRALSKYLINELKVGSEEAKLKSAFFLMSQDNIKGLEYYNKYLSKKKEFYPRTYRGNPFSYIKSIKAIPILINLLKLSYDKELKEDRFDSLYRVVENVLSNIALISARNFNIVIKSINGFIKNQANINDQVHFLYTFIERLERQYYFSINKSISINDAKLKLKNICI